MLATLAYLLMEVYLWVRVWDLACLWTSKWALTSTLLHTWYTQQVLGKYSHFCWSDNTLQYSQTFLSSIGIFYYSSRCYFSCYGQIKDYLKWKSAMSLNVKVYSLYTDSALSIVIINQPQYASEVKLPNYKTFLSTCWVWIAWLQESTYIPQ